MELHIIPGVASRKSFCEKKLHYLFGNGTSQVIPVYPLTEDLQPGDVFLVQTPVEKQVEVYNQRGFLPLEQMLLRLQPEAYREFYLHSHGIGDRADTPHHWKFPAEAEKTTDWPSAPWASLACPRYRCCSPVAS